MKSYSDNPTAAGAIGGKKRPEISRTVHPGPGTVPAFSVFEKTELVWYYSRRSGPSPSG